MPQREKLFIEMLKKVRIGHLDDCSEKMLKLRLVNTKDPDYSKHTLHKIQKFHLISWCGN